MTKAIAGLCEIAGEFDVVLLDQWGALHEGQGVFPAAQECVSALHEAGKKTIVLSNSGKRAEDNATRLSALGLPANLYDGVLSSGEVAWRGLRDRHDDPFRALGRRCYLIARGNDRSIVSDLPLDIAGWVEDADFILLSGLDDAQADIALWQSVFTAASKLGLPMLCANPDLTMFGKDGLIPAPGALAARYAEMGGRVTYIGKPHAPIFTAALTQLGHPDPTRVVMIGDSLDHDIAGGRKAGIRTVLIASGVHRDTLIGKGDLAQVTRVLAGADDNAPDWVIERLAW
jgi:HAD superfamily hydrolase (TIGR01459 family)